MVTALQKFRAIFVRKVEATRREQNDMRPFLKMFFRRAFKRRANEKGDIVEFAQKDVPNEPLSREEQHEQIIASYNTSH